jgi:hypothetical protein
MPLYMSRHLDGVDDGPAGKCVSFIFQSKKKDYTVVLERVMWKFFEYNLGNSSERYCVWSIREKSEKICFCLSPYCYEIRVL